MKEFIMLIYIYIYEFLLSPFTASSYIMKKIHKNDIRKKKYKALVKEKNLTVYKILISLVIILYLIYGLIYLSK